MAWSRLMASTRGRAGLELCRNIHPGCSVRVNVNLNKKNPKSYQETLALLWAHPWAYENCRMLQLCIQATGVVLDNATRYGLHDTGTFQETVVIRAKKSIGVLIDMHGHFVIEDTKIKVNRRLTKMEKT